MTTEIIEVLVDPATIIEVIDVGPVGPPGDTAYFPFAKPGFLSAPYTSPLSFPVPLASVLDSIILSVGTAPTGSDLILDIFRNGTTIYAGGVGRPRVLAGHTTGTGTTGSPSPAVFAQEDLIEFQIAQVGSTMPGANLVMILALKRA